jgi:hypothetical protein
VEPETIVTAVAQNIIWKRKKADCHDPSSRDQKKPVAPMKPLVVAPYMRAKPKDQNKIVDIPKSVMFFMATFMLFLDRVNPDSRQVNPACMRNTSPAQIMTQKISSNVFSNTKSPYESSSGKRETGQ